MIRPPLFQPRGKDMQTDLFDTRLQRKFEEYHRENPHVYKLFQKYALEILGAGHERFSAKAIFERIRWHIAMETTGDTYKLNNNYTAFYARKLMDDQPMFKGFFETREQKAA